jgi:hypothetical protein
MGGDAEFWGDTKSREARLATPHRLPIEPAFSSLYLLYLRSAGGGMRAARCIVPLSYSPYARPPISYPHSRVPNRIHPSGFTTASRVGTIAIYYPHILRSPVPAADRMASIHPLREALVQREKTAYSLSPARGRSIRLSLGGGRTRGRENQRGQSLFREAPCRWAKHSQIPERRARIHPPIPAFPLWGRGATFRTIARDQRCPVPRLFSTSPSSLLS